MTNRAPTRPAACRIRPPSVVPSATLPALGITAYGCDPDETTVFAEVAGRLGVVPTITAAPVSAATVDLAHGARCISVGHKTPISSALLGRLSRVGVAYISTRSVGVNHIDEQCARGLGITVEPVAYSPDSVADYTLMLILMALRNATSVLRRTSAHDFRLPDVRGRELRDLTVGVVGTGRIGSAVVDRLRGFGGRILTHDVLPATAEHHVPLDALLQHSDVVTLHTPLTPATQHLLDRRRIDALKQGAVVVNTGRGGLVDTAALVAALERGALGGAALDVLEGEDGIFYADFGGRPLPHPLLLRLQQLPNVVISPHTAYYTDHALRDAVENSVLGCLRFAGRNHG